MRPGMTILTIPGPWYVTAELTGPADRGSQLSGIWTGLAGADLGIQVGDPVKSSVLGYLIDRFGGFDVIVAGDRNKSAQYAEALIEARDVREFGDSAMAQLHEQRASDVWAAFERSARAALAAMQRAGKPLVDERVTAWHRPDPPSLGREWIIASFRHDTDDETGDPLLHIHNVVPAITDRQWNTLRDLAADTAAEPA